MTCRSAVDCSTTELTAHILPYSELSNKTYWPIRAYSSIIPKSQFSLSSFDRSRKQIQSRAIACAKTPAFIIKILQASKNSTLDALYVQLLVHFLLLLQQRHLQCLPVYRWSRDLDHQLNRGF